MGHLRCRREPNDYYLAQFPVNPQPTIEMETDMALKFTCDLSQQGRDFPHFWEHTLGSGHATLGLRADWQQQLLRARDELGVRHVRFHGILDDDVGTLTNQMDQLLYSFHNSDQIFDYLLSIGIRPFVELSFMPLTLSSGDKIVFHYKGNITPPRDYGQWGELIRRLVQHWVDRYGINEVSQWFFEVWNEPNLDAFWSGTQDEYFHLYEVTAKAVKSVDPSLRVGGPATAANAWIDAFLAFTKKADVSVDFVSTHHYPTDAFGSPGDDTVTQLEKSRLGVLREDVEKVKRQTGDLPVYYTEWSTSSNPRDTLHDDSYCAAYIVHTLMSLETLVEGYSYWAFSDIFEENYFPSIPFHGGFGLMNMHGIPKPSWRAYQLLHALGTTRLDVDGAHESVKVWALRGDEKITLLAINLALPRHDIKTETVSVSLGNGTVGTAAKLARIDADHANAKTHWQKMGAPEYPMPEQVAAMLEASKLTWEKVSIRDVDGNASIEVSLAPNSVTAIEIPV